jgi:hypothetical protein
MTTLPYNVRIIEVAGMGDSVTEHVIIDRGNDEFTSMPKEVWDAQQITLAPLTLTEEE